MAKFAQSTNERRLDKLQAQFAESLSRTVAAFSDDTPAGLMDRYKTAQSGEYEFGKLYLPHYFSKPPAEFHHELFAMSRVKQRHLFVFHAPRERGKSVILRSIKIRNILLGLKKFQLKASETLGLAIDDIAYIITDLEQNPRIEQDFKVVFMMKDFTAGEFVIQVTPRATNVMHTVKLMAVSYGTPVRGKLFMEWRPDWADIDDFENKRSAKNPIIGREKVDWVMSELFLAMADTAPILWAGNNIAKTGAMNQAFTRECRNLLPEDLQPVDLARATMPDSSAGINAENSDAGTGKADLPARRPARRLSVEAAQRQGQARIEAVLHHDVTGHVYRELYEEHGVIRSLWPEKSTVEQSMRLRDVTIGSRRFEAEMQGNPVEEGLIFKPDWKRTYRMDDVVGEDRRIKLKRIVGYIDQALGTGKTSAFKALIIVGADGQNYYILDCWLRQASQTALMDATYHLYTRWAGFGLNRFPIDNNFHQYTLVTQRDWTAAAKQRGYPIPLVPKEDNLSKEIRIEGIAPLMETGVILWPDRFHEDLVTLWDQLMGYPDLPFKDGPDALAGCIIDLQSSAMADHIDFKSTAERRYKRRR